MKTQNIKTAKTRKLTKQILLSAVVFLFSLKSYAADYYWVGGTGNWSDFANHWATTSGGTTYHTQPPDEFSDVYFDNNSFFSNNDSVYSGTGYNRCNSVNLNSAFIPLLPHMQVTSNINLLTPANPANGASILRFYLQGLGNNNTITTGGNTVSIVIDSSGTWYLQDDFTGEFHSSYGYGNLYTNNHTIHFTEPIEIYPSFTYLIDFGSSSVYSSAGSYINVEGNIKADSASFYLNDGFYHIGLGGIHLRVNYISATNVSLYGDTVNTVIVNDSFFYFSQCSIKNLVINGTANPLTITSEDFSPFSQFGKLTINSADCLFKSDTAAGYYFNPLYMDTLFISNPNANIQIEAGDTLFITDEFFANYSAGNAISIQSVTPGSPCYISKSSGTVCLDYLNLRDVHAIGGATFYAGSNSIDLGGNSGWSFTNCATAAGYYWVGGTGNWSDFANHWATTSGGTTFQTVPPGPLDDVYFDSNSFVGSFDTVYVDPGLTNIYCRDFKWTNIQNNATFSVQANSDLNVFGSFFLSNNINFSLLGILTFQGNASNQIFMDGITVPHNGFTDKITFNGDGVWELLSPLDVEGILFLKGTLITNSQPLTLSYGFVCHPVGLDSCAVLLGESEILIGHIWQIFSTPKTFIDADNVTIKLDYGISPGFMISTFQNIDSTFYKNIIFLNNGIIESPTNSTHILGKVTAIKDLYFMNGDADIDTLFLNNPGYELKLSASRTYKIHSSLITAGSSSFPITMLTSVSGISATIEKTTDVVCIHDVFLKDIAATGGATFYAGTGSFDLGGNSGWQFTPCTVVSDVWPGDANYDLTANNNDVLNIGLAYGETGPVRAGASNTWVAQPATDWSSFFQSAVNKKHADCDGNGVVDNNDTLAVSLNYGLTHPARLANPNSNLSISSPQLYLIANPDTVMEGDTVEVDIYLGTQSIPVDSIYGIAFTINFDTALVDTSWMPFDFTGSWIGTTGVDLLAFDHKVFSQGKADVALTRTDHTNASGYGYIGKMGAVIVDNVGTRLTTSPPYVTLPLSISNVTALTATEFYLTISTGTENVEIDTLGITGIHQPLNDAPFSVYPNPVYKKLNVFSYWLKGETMCMVELYNIVGEKLISKQVPVSQNRFSIDVSTIPQDMYFIKVITAKGTVNKKILVVKK